MPPGWPAGYPATLHKLRRGDAVSVFGWKYSLLAAFIGILLAGSYSIYLLVSKKIDKKGHIAFGPYLSIGIFIALSYGSEIISWYLNLMM